MRLIGGLEKQIMTKKETVASRDCGLKDQQLSKLGIYELNYCQRSMRGQHWQELHIPLLFAFL